MITDLVYLAAGVGASQGAVFLRPRMQSALERRRDGRRPRIGLKQVTRERYSQSYGWSGQMYQVAAPKGRHCCENRNEVRNRSIWICECGRAYVQRGWQHGFRDSLRQDRKYWWRVRWFLPWQWYRAWIVRGLKRDRYLLEGMGSE